MCCCVRTADSYLLHPSDPGRLLIGILVVGNTVQTRMTRHHVDGRQRVGRSDFRTMGPCRGLFTSGGREGFLAEVGIFARKNMSLRTIDQSSPAPADPFAFRLWIVIVCTVGTFAVPELGTFKPVRPRNVFVVPSGVRLPNDPNFAATGKFALEHGHGRRETRFGAHDFVLGGASFPRDTNRYRSS